jgi:hypothetical protein
LEQDLGLAAAEGETLQRRLNEAQAAVTALRASAAASEARVSELAASSAGKESRVAELLQQLQGRIGAEEAAHTREMQRLSERMLELQEANTALLRSRVFEPAQAAIDTYTARVAGLLTRFGEVTDTASVMASRLEGLQAVREGGRAGAAAQPPALEGAAATPVEPVPAWLAAALIQLQEGVSAASRDAAMCAPLLTLLRDLHSACVHALVAACRHRSVSRDILSALPLPLRAEVQAARGAASAIALEVSAASALARDGSAPTLSGGRVFVAAPRVQRSSGARRSVRGSEAARDASTTAEGPAPASASFLASRRDSMGSQISRASSFLTHSNATTGTAVGHLPYGPDSGELVALTLSHIQAALAEGLAGGTSESAASVRPGSRVVGMPVLETRPGAAHVPQRAAASRVGHTRGTPAAVPLSASPDGSSTTSRAPKGAAGYSQQYQRQREQNAGAAGAGTLSLPGQPSTGGVGGRSASASPPRPADDTPPGARSRPAVPRTLHY